MLDWFRWLRDFHPASPVSWEEISLCFLFYGLKFVLLVAITSTTGKIIKITDIIKLVLILWTSWKEHICILAVLTAGCEEMVSQFVFIKN